MNPPVALRSHGAAITLSLVLGLSLYLVASEPAQCQSSPPDRTALAQQVADAERRFARSMAQRDHAAFVQFVSEDALFFGRRALHGRAEVAAAWKPFFDGPKAPFSWEPDQVEIAPSGLVAHSTGPVYDPDGKLVSRFNSVWKLEAPGVWRVIVDKGEALPCDCAAGKP
jgi:ketosteroid isomerase-like protein